MEESDYEEWIPHTVDEGGCLDGRKVVMIRKKSERQCFNPDNFTMYYTQSTCKCTSDDYHCDFGYAYDDNGNCVLDPFINQIGSSEQEPPICKDYWY